MGEPTIDNVDKSKELVQYYVVNKTLNMSAGKIAAQVGHASRLSALRDQNEAIYKDWLNIQMKTIVLQGKETKLRQILEQNPSVIAVIDNGLTEIPKGSMTVIVLPVMTREEAQPYIERLQTLKDKVIKE